jgi:hypothetical protein
VFLLSDHAFEKKQKLCKDWTIVGLDHDKVMTNMTMKFGIAAQIIRCLSPVNC